MRKMVASEVGSTWRMGDLPKSKPLAWHGREFARVTFNKRSERPGLLSSSARMQMYGEYRAEVGRAGR